MPLKKIEKVRTPTSVAKTGDKDMIWFTTPCSCHDEHLTAVVEIVEYQWADDEHKAIAPYIGVEFYYKVWKNCDIDWASIGSILGQIKDYWRRVKDAYKLIMDGTLEYEGQFMFIDYQHAKDFASALAEGIEDVEKELKKQKKKKVKNSLENV